MIVSDYDDTFYINEEDVKKNVSLVHEFMKDNILTYFYKGLVATIYFLTGKKSKIQNLYVDFFEFSHHNSKKARHNAPLHSFSHNQYAITASRFADSLKDLRYAYSSRLCILPPSIPRESRHGRPYTVISAASEPPLL